MFNDGSVLKMKIQYRAQSQAGFTLVELMVAMTIGLLVSAAALQLLSEELLQLACRRQMPNCRTVEFLVLVILRKISV